MSSETDLSTFEEAFTEYRKYPSSGSRKANDGVPAGPTLAASVLEKVFGIPVSPINSETREVLAGLYLLATGEPEGSIPETVVASEDKETLRREAEKAVFERYGSADNLTVPVVGSPNYSSPAIAAIAEVSLGIDPVEATRDRLDGETKRLGGPGEE